MKLITKEIEKKIPALYSTDGQKGDRPVVAKFFTPWTSWTWFVLEGEKLPNGDWVFFGLVRGAEVELGYFALSELEAIRGPMGLTIERDMYTAPATLAEAAPDFCDRLWGEDK